jgi:hypothetical protein
MEMDWQAVKAVLREVLQEEMAMGRCALTPRFSGGKLIIQPADVTQKSREIPVETFFKKITSVREKLRVLEQKLNNNDRLSLEERAEYQQMISRIYGSLTTFNFLFHEEEDRFTGQRST